MKSKISLFIVIALLFGCGVASFVQRRTHHKPPADRKIIVDIGAYPNLQAEQQASLQRLSAELFQHPEANAVRIIAGKSAWRQGIMGFIRTSAPGNKNLFWYDDRFSSPVLGYVRGKSQGISVIGLVSEEPIHVVAARKKVSPVDVLAYNQQLRVKLGIDKPKTVIAVERPQHQI